MSELSPDVEKLIQNPKVRDELLKSLLLSKGTSIKFEKDKVQSQVEDLRYRKSKLEEEIDYAAGDIVVWKDKLKNKNFPLHGQPAIVIEVLDQPRYDDSAQIGSHIFKEPHDLILGLIMENGDFLTFHFDKRRFKKYN
ncbi:hypothetical protein C9994_07265 [Marivirga lumbricoides]|uniref:Uncharacterized protein n=1 Tax=Marivirga lumbricoides TaxID=1046115 RepID=A0A2T4DRM4_9BACT|nr:hypothetical protein C9994_07265 [Marivirga lumbricoides]